MTETAPARPPGAPGGHAAHWYGLRVRSQYAFRLAEEIEALGLDVFLPTWTENVRWADRVKAVRRPLFPGYLFVRERAECVERLQRLHFMSGAISLLPDDLRPAPIPESEIESVRAVLASGLPAAACDFAIGEQVVIDSGPLAGVTGFVTKTKGAMDVVVSIEILRRSVRVTLGAETLRRKAA